MRIKSSRKIVKMHAVAVIALAMAVQLTMQTAVGLHYSNLSKWGWECRYPEVSLHFSFATTCDVERFRYI
jgi:hypothetical protein